MKPDRRAVSTVLDVAMALLLISASITIIALYLDSSDEDIDVQEPDHTAETIAGSTISVEYSVASAEPEFHGRLTDGERQFDRVAHGPASGLLADAAIANMQLGNQTVLAYGADVEDAIDASIRSALVGSNHQFYATATWIPYENASISGQASAGVSPPADENIATTTMTTSSGFDAVDTEAMAGAYYHEYAASRDHEQALQNASTEIAVVIVDEQFDTERSQHTLESLGLERELKVYHFEQFGTEVGAQFDPDDGDLSRHNATATGAKAELTEHLAAWIAADLADEPLAEDLESVPDTHPNNEDWEEAFRLVLADAFSTDTVTITVQTWSP